jgi:hypothetical protein
MTDSNKTLPASPFVWNENSLVAGTLREVARDAALLWAREHMATAPHSDPEGFGKAVAKVFLATLTQLSADCEPDAVRPEGCAQQKEVTHG